LDGISRSGMGLSAPLTTRYGSSSTLFSSFPNTTGPPIGVAAKEERQELEDPSRHQLFLWEAMALSGTSSSPVVSHVSPNNSFPAGIKMPTSASLTTLPPPLPPQRHQPPPLINISGSGTPKYFSTSSGGGSSATSECRSGPSPYTSIFLTPPSNNIHLICPSPATLNQSFKKTTTTSTLGYQGEHIGGSPEEEGHYEPTTLSKYDQLLLALQDIERDMRPSYAGSKTSLERLKRAITLARFLVKDAMSESTELCTSSNSHESSLYQQDQPQSRR